MLVLVGGCSASVEVFAQAPGGHWQSPRQVIILPTFELSHPVELCRSRRQLGGEAWPKNESVAAQHNFPKNLFLGWFSSFFLGAPSSHDPPGQRTEKDHY